jgi:hypothetical protein
MKKDDISSVNGVVLRSKVTIQRKTRRMLPTVHDEEAP